MTYGPSNYGILDSFPNWRFDSQDYPQTPLSAGAVITETPTGGVVCAGEGLASLIMSMLAAGGVVISGESVLQAILAASSSGGVVIDGNNTEFLTFDPGASGGVVNECIVGR